MVAESWTLDLPSKHLPLPQEEEWVLVRFAGRVEKIRLQDYARLYRVPGLYEELLCRHLQYRSPWVIPDLLRKGLTEADGGRGALRILELGAGNGIAGERLRQILPVDVLVGVDILPEARQAARRDRPGLYDAYYVMDLCNLTRGEEQDLGAWAFNVLVSVGALGFHDVPAPAFLHAFRYLQEGGWVAFNIHETYLSRGDKSGFRSAIEALVQQSLIHVRTRHYRHRLSVCGLPIHYRAFAGKKRPGTHP